MTGRNRNRQRKGSKFGCLPVLVIFGIAYLFILRNVRSGVFLLPLVVLAALIPTFLRNAKEKPPARPRTNEKSGEICPNPEPHRHYDSVPAQDVAERRKRLDNIRVLYEAGILTREEYDYEVRRIKNS